MDQINEATEGATPSPPDIEADINDFAASIKAISRSQPLTMSMISMTHMMLNRKHLEFLNSHCEVIEVADGSITAKIPHDQMHRWSQERNELHSLQRALDILPPTYVVALVSQLDFFLGKLLRWIFWVKPEILNSSDRTLTLAQLSDFSSIKEAREVFIEKEVENFLRKSHIEQFKWIEDRLNIPLRKDLPAWPNYVELTERRNLFVHANGRVSRHYLQAVESVGISIDKLSIGDSLVADREYFRTAYACIFEVAFKLAQVVWRKLEPSSAKNADGNYMAVQYELLLSREFKLAAMLGEFYRKYIKRPCSDEYRRIILINEGIALLGSQNTHACNELLAREDWSSCSLKFKLAVEVLTGSLDKVLHYMGEIGTNGEINKQDYANWPLFSKLRNNEQFLRKYSDIFGQKIEISEAFKTRKPESEDGETNDVDQEFQKMLEDLQPKDEDTKR